MREQKDSGMAKLILVFQLPLIIALVCLYFGIRFVQQEHIVLAVLMFILVIVMGLVYYVAMKLFLGGRKLSGNNQLVKSLLDNQGQNYQAQIISRLLIYTPQTNPEQQVSVKIEQKQNVLNILDDLIQARKMQREENNLFKAFLRIEYTYQVNNQILTGMAQLENPFLFGLLKTGEQITVKIVPQKPELHELDMTQWSQQEVAQKSQMPILKNKVLEVVAFGLDTTLGVIEKK